MAGWSFGLGKMQGTRFHNRKIYLITHQTRRFARSRTPARLNSFPQVASGTNGPRIILPPGVAKLELEEHKQTIVSVLEHLLWSAYSVRLIPPRPSGAS